MGILRSCPVINGVLIADEAAERLRQQCRLNSEPVWLQQIRNLMHSTVHFEKLFLEMLEIRS
jgi:hypothetical protein